jgi:diguanylate cyclase (GGDEF)-like protein/PAS domain S-box-containing protein
MLTGSELISSSAGSLRGGPQALILRELEVEDVPYQLIFGDADDSNEVNSLRWNYAEGQLLVHVVSALRLSLRALNDRRDLQHATRHSRSLSLLSLELGDEPVGLRQWRALFAKTVQWYLRGSAVAYFKWAGDHYEPRFLNGTVVAEGGWWTDGSAPRALPWCTRHSTFLTASTLKTHQCLGGSILVRAFPNARGFIVVPVWRQHGVLDLLVVVRHGERPIRPYVLPHLDTLAQLGSAGVTLRDQQLATLENKVMKETLADALDQAVEGIAILDIDTQVTFANSAYLAMHTIPRDQLTATNARSLYPPSISVETIEHFAQVALAKGAAVGQFPRLRGDGTTFQAQVMLAPLRRANGQQTGWIVTVIDMSDQAETVERLRIQALTDPLTSINNRRAIVESLRELLAQGSSDEQVGVLFIDIDRFKLVNDSFGHQVGDEFLRIISARITGAVRPKDIVGRLGGDEFMVVLPGLKSRGVAKLVANRIQQAISNGPIIIDGHRLRCAASLGIAFGTPRQTDADTLIHHADAAMYQSKRSSRATSVYQAETYATAHRHNADQEIAEALRESLSDPAQPYLRLLYAPVVELLSRRVRGFSVEPRWSHPVFGEVDWEGLKAITLASRLVEEVSTWLTTSAIAALQDLAARSGGETLRLNFGYPIHDAVLAERRLLKQTTSAFESNLPQQHLVFEVPESALAHEDVAAVGMGLDHLARSGHTVAIAGFGERASMQQLIDAPARILKIAPASKWETWATASRYLGAAVALSQEIGLDLVAYRVESEDDFLTVAPRVQFIQGSFVGAPVARDEVLTRIQAIEQRSFPRLP